jgi:hypothetical protein
MKILVYPLIIMFMLMLAYVDYLTSDYSLVLFYILIVLAATWYTNIVFGICSAILCALVEAISDYYVHHDAVFNYVYYWNWTCNLMIYATFCFIIHYIRIKKNYP